MAVSKRTRYEVLRRDDFTCRYCRSKDGELHVDHVTPVSLGGSDKPDNLVAACKDCNSGKASSTPGSEDVETVRADAARWAAAMKEAARVMSDEVDTFADYEEAFYRGWPSYRYAPKGIEGTLAALYQAGLPAEHIEDVARIAGNNSGVLDRAAYFAGICWKRVRKMQEIAERIAAEGAQHGE